MSEELRRFLYDLSDSAAMFVALLVFVGIPILVLFGDKIRLPDGSPRRPKPPRLRDRAAEADARLVTETKAAAATLTDEGGMNAPSGSPVGAPLALPGKTSGNDHD